MMRSSQTSHLQPHPQGHMNNMMHNLGGLQSSVKSLKRNSEKMLSYYLTRSSEVDRNAMRLRCKFSQPRQPTKPNLTLTYPLPVCTPTSSNPGKTELSLISHSWTTLVFTIRLELLQLLCFHINESLLNLKTSLIFYVLWVFRATFESGKKRTCPRTFPNPLFRFTGWC